jgi:hypothetical protein
LRRVALASLTLAGACIGGSGDWDAVCRPGETEQWSLPAEIPEASGLAVSRTHPGLVWTHNDGPDGILYGLALPSGGGEARILARVRVPGPFRDVEDLELAPCDTGWCLYLADTGDNLERRDHLVVVGIPEPNPADSTVGADVVRRLELRFPDHPRDVEALAVLEGGSIHLLSKGRSGPPTWFRVPAGASAGRHTLEFVAEVGEGRSAIPDLVTGATSISGAADLVLVRSYQAIEVHEIGPDGARRSAGPRSILHLGEAQGEGVALAPDGSLLLASEASPLGGRGGIVRVRCGG